MSLIAKILIYAAIMIAGIVALVVWYIHDKRKMPVCRECRECKYNNLGECESTILCERGEMCEPMDNGGTVK